MIKRAAPAWHFASIRHRSLSRSPLRQAGLVALALVMGGMTGVVTPPMAQAQQDIQRIAAVVNDKVISLRDVKERMALTMVSSSLPNTPENQRRILPSVVRSLVDDQLRLQEAQRLKVTVSDAEIQQAIQRIEKANHMQQGTLPEMLRQAGLPETALTNQIKPQIAWAKAAQKSLRRNIYVQPEEVDATLAQLKAIQGLPQRHMAEILVPVNSPDQEQQAKALANRLAEQIRSGSKFSALAQQFSSAPTAGRGGDLGWVAKGQLSADVEGAVSQLQPGQITDPIRTTSGYTIMLLIERRAPTKSSPDDIEYQLSQLYLPTQGSAALSKEKRTRIENKAKTDIQSCQDMNDLAQDEDLPSSGDIGLMKLADLPTPVATAARSLKEGAMSAPISLSSADVIIMLCSKRDPNGLPSRDEITRKLEREKLDRAAERRLRDLRRDALIDIRL